MEFIYPNFLWALFAILIPVIIHLFYFKRFKKVYFSNTKFLKEIKEETTNKNKIKNLLVLLSRILAIVFLVLAFAQPYFPIGHKLKKGSKGVSIYIDNSFSMQALGEEATMIDKAKKTAKEIVNGYSDDTRFQIITNKLYGSEQKWLDKQNALNNIDLIKLNPLVKNFKNISKRQKQAFETEGIENKYIYWLSDFQLPVFDIDSTDIDTTMDYNLIFLQSIREKNISIDSCFWDKPVPVFNQTNKLFVKVSNYSKDEADLIPVNLEYNSQNYPSGKIDLKSMSSGIDTIDVKIKTKGWSSAKVSIKDYPVIFDDDYYLAFEIPSKIKILNINQSNKANKYLIAAFDNDNLFDFNYSPISKVDYSDLNTYNLIILENIKTMSSGLQSTLKKAATAGTNIILFPDKNADLNSLNSFLQSVNANTLREFRTEPNEANKLNRNEYIFKNVYDNLKNNFTPVKVKGYYDIQNFQAKNAYHIIKFKNGKSFIDRYRYGSGNIFVAASPFDEKENDLCKKPDIFVPLIFNMSIISNNEKKLSYIIGQDRSIVLDKINTSEKGLIRIKGAGREFIPKQINIQNKVKLDVQDQITAPGIYDIYKENTLLQKVAFNYDRRESKLEYYNENQIKEQLGDQVVIYGKNKSKINFTEEINSKQNGIELWKWSLLLALLFLGIEILLLRFWKKT